MAKSPKKRVGDQQKTLVEVSDRGTLTLPKALRSTGLFEVRTAEGGIISLIPQHTVDASQAYFWSERWQAMEREADADVVAGRVVRFASGDALIEELEKS